MARKYEMKRRARRQEETRRRITEAAGVLDNEGCGTERSWRGGTSS